MRKVLAVAALFVVAFLAPIVIVVAGPVAGVAAGVLLARSPKGAEWLQRYLPPLASPWRLGLGIAAFTVPPWIAAILLTARLLQP